MSSKKTANSDGTPPKDAIALIRIASPDKTLEEERQRRFLAYQERKREQREDRALGD
jgi:hypothetical protein